LIKTLKLLVSALAVGVAGASLAGSAQAAGPCNDLSGYYGNVTAIVVGADNKTVNVTLAGGRPLAYGTCSGNTLSVNFKQPDSVATGTFDGKTIKWSNNTTWTKQ